MSLEEFFQLVLSNAEEMLPNTSDHVWYRGHGSTEYMLLPTVFRRAIGNEAALFYEYKAHAAAINGQSKDDWDSLLDMQHYGLPTRLLDWTTSLGTALYFALKGNPDSPCIWLLDPYKLSFESTQDTIIYDTTRLANGSNSYDVNYDIADIIMQRSEIEVPFSIQPPHGNRRIAAQRGRFTVHTANVEPIEVQCPNCVRKIDIPLELIQPLKMSLAIMGIDDYSQFPDQYGLSEYLNGLYVGE